MVESIRLLSGFQAALLEPHTSHPLCEQVPCRLILRLVSRARLSLRRRESGQFPIIIGLVTYRGTQLPFLACCLERRRHAFASYHTAKPVGAIFGAQ